MALAQGGTAAVPAAPYASIEAAQASADAAKAESAQIQEKYEAEVQACMHEFFATRCSEKARDARNDEHARTDGVRQKAELFIRQERSRARHEKRDQENASRDARVAERAAQRANEAQRPPAKPAEVVPEVDNPVLGGPPVVQEGKSAPSRAVDDPAVRAQNRATFERKQQEAREYAEKQARQREEATAKRERRRAQREAQMQRLNQEQPAPAAP